ncbi:hypothetical protein JW960_03400 [candidate division KSB1 bacterium]|nr:hypothetical protein [candidate division KSB1 bacterium]
MNDYQTLYLVFVLLYLAECVKWTHRYSILIYSAIGNYWHVKFASNSLGNRTGGFAFNNPIPPLGYLFHYRPLPFSISPTAITSFITQVLTDGGQPKQLKRVFQFDQIKTVTQNSNHININAELFLSCRSEADAKKFIAIISELKAIDKNQRARYITDFISRQFDIQQISTTYKTYRKQTRILRLLCNILWLYLLVLPLAIINYLGITPVVMWLGVSYVVFHLLTIIAFVIAFRQLQPDFMNADFYSRLAIILLFPPATIRCIDLVTYDLFSDFHPLASLHVLASDSTKTMFAKKLLLDLSYPIFDESASPSIKETCDWYNTRQIEIIRKFLRDNNINPYELLIPTFSESDQIKSYCPRCQTGYSVTKGTCPDCGQIELIKVEQN